MGRVEEVQLRGGVGVRDSLRGRGASSAICRLVILSIDREPRYGDIGGVLSSA